MKKSVSDIQVGDKINLTNTGFEYVVTWISEASILINRANKKWFIPKSLIQLLNSLTSTHGYTLFYFKDLPEWFIAKNNII